MKNLTFAVSAALLLLGSACFTGHSGTGFEIFDYSTGEVINRLPPLGYHRELLGEIITSDGHGASIKSAFFTIAQEGENRDARLIVRRRDHSGNEVRRFQLPRFDAAWFQEGVHAFSSDGRKLAYWKGRKHLHVRDLASGSDRVVFTLPNAKGKYLKQLAWPTSGRLVIAFTRYDDPTAITIQVLGLDGNARSRTFPNIRSYPGLGVSPDGKWMWAVRGRASPGKDGQVVIVNLEALRIDHAVPMTKTPQPTGHGVWSDHSRSLVFKVWTEMAADKKPADFYHYRLADKSLKHVTTGIGGDQPIAIVNGQIHILKNRSSVHVFSERDNSFMGVLPSPKAGGLRRIPGTTRWVYIPH